MATDTATRHRLVTRSDFDGLVCAALLKRLGILDEVYRHLPRVHIEADFHRPLEFRDVVDATITVTAVGTTSLTYAFTLERDGERCVTMTVVTALLPADDGARVWADDHRRLLLKSGPQPPELLVAGHDRGVTSRS